MHPLALRPSSSGDGVLSIWKTPDPRYQALISCDPSLGRISSAKRDDSAVHVWFRHPGNVIEMAAQFLSSKWNAHALGSLIAALARWYGHSVVVGDVEVVNAVVNIEHNISDMPHHSLTVVEDFPLSGCFVPRDQRALIDAGQPHHFYTHKSNHNEKTLLDNMEWYFSRGAVLIRDAGTLLEVASVARDPNTGRVKMNGLDRASSVLMACDADFQLPPAIVSDVAPQESQVPAMFGSVRWMNEQRPGAEQPTFALLASHGK
jgi:hypothetical protein